MSVLQPVGFHHHFGIRRLHAEHEVVIVVFPEKQVDAACAVVNFVAMSQRILPGNGQLRHPSATRSRAQKTVAERRDKTHTADSQLSLPL